MKSINDFDFRDKRVLVRVDFNVSLGNGSIFNDFKIRASLPTIEYLIKQGARIILISHLGRPTDSEKQFSLEQVGHRLSKLINKQVLFINNCLGEDVKREVEGLKSGGVVLLENLRFYDGEKDNDSDFAKELAGLADIYINDAFGVSHRTHASVVGIPRYLSGYMGLLMEKEIRNLSKVLKEPDHPLVVIIGGAKISTKIRMIKNFLKNADHIILGGALANTVIAAKGFAIGKSVIEESMIDEIKKLELTDTSLHIPVDAVVSVDKSGEKESRIAPIGKTNKEEMILDIGPDTNNLFADVVSDAKTIVWNGPMGLFEIDRFASGSRAMAEAVCQSGGFSVVGGGETIRLIEEMKLIDRIDHLSTGGGAMLKYLSGEKLPGLEVLWNGK